MKSAAEHRYTPPETFLLLCKAHGLPEPAMEVRFHSDRMWRFDYVFPGQIAIEQNGGIWSRGRHSRGGGQLRDFEKLNEAQLAGYLVGQFTPQQMASGEAIGWVKRALAIRALSQISERIEQGA